MTTPTGLRPDPTEHLERELQRRLGLDSYATPEDLDAAHESVIEFLGQAPRELRAWARAQAAGADEAYALLTDPAALARSAALVGAAGRPAPLPGGPATPPVRRETSRPAAAAATVVADPEPRRDEDGRPVLSDDEFDALLAEVTPSAHRETVSGPAPAVRATPASGGQGGSRRMVVMAAGAVLAIAALFVVYQAGGGGKVGVAAAAANPTPTASAGIDEAAVAALMQKYQANPKDYANLMALGDAFYQANDFANAASWFKQATAVNTTSVEALLAYGAASFNANDSATAETTWKQALALDPKNVEAHYDLGYLYFSATPQDVAGVEREWNQVIALDPGSDTAKQVQAHLAILASPAPSGSPAASGPPAGSPAASGSPAGSAAASAGPTGSPAASPAPSPAASAAPTAAPSAAASPSGAGAGR